MMKTQKKGIFWPGYILAPLTVLAVLAVLFAQTGLYPFGDKCISWCDMNQQVIPLLAEFKEILSGKSLETLFYSHNNCGGMNFWGVFFFFAASPLSLMVAFVKEEKLMLFMNVLTALKMAFCALSAYICIAYRAKKEEKSMWLPLLLGVMYAFSGYAMMYYQNSIWLDVMALFPLMYLGMEILVDKGKLWLYTISIALIVAVNYYLGVQVAVFALLNIGLVMLVERKKRAGSIALRFIIGSVIAALMTAVVWYPSLLQFLTSPRSDSFFFNSIKSATPAERLNTTLPLVLPLAGGFGTLLVSFLCRDFREAKPALLRQFRREAILFVLLLIPVFIKPIDLMWHAGSYMSFPARMSFMTAFMGAMLFYRAMSFFPLVILEKPYQKWLGLLGLLLTLGFAFGAKWFFDKNADTLTVFVRTLWGDDASLKLLLVFAAVIFVVSALVYLFYRLGTSRGLSLVLAGFLLTSQIVFSLNVYMLSVNASSESFSDFETLRNDALETQNESGVYRTKMFTRFVVENWEGTLGAGALSHYTSLTPETYLFLMKQMGYTSYWMKISSAGGTAFSDAFWGMQNLLSTKSRAAKDPVFSDQNKYALSKLSYWFPMGLVADGEKLSGLELGKERLDYQESLFEALFGDLYAEEGGLFASYTDLCVCDGVSIDTKNNQYSIKRDSAVDKPEIKWDVYVEGGQILYFEAFKNYTNKLSEGINGSFDIYVNNRLIAQEYPSQGQNGIINLGSFKDETVSVRVRVRKNVSLYSLGLSGLKLDLLEKAEKLAQNASDIHPVKNGYEGCVYAAKSGELVLSLAEDPGYTVLVDGAAAEIHRTAAGLMSVSLGKGEHGVSVLYTVPGIKAGAVISALGILLFILCLAIKPKKRAKDAPASTPEKIAVIALKLCFFILIVGLYLIPCVVNVASLLSKS